MAGKPCGIRPGTAGDVDEIVESSSGFSESEIEPVVEDAEAHSAEDRADAAGGAPGADPSAADASGDGRRDAPTPRCGEGDDD